MSADKTTNGTIDPILQPFFDLWSDYYKQVNDATRELLDNFEDGANPKNWQRRWNEAVSKSADAYMRSPAFLHAMKQNTDAAIKIKQQADDLAKEFARNANIPTASDISGLFERMHCVEEVIRGRLCRIEQRLEAIEERAGIDQLAHAK
jgi:hypothetical protein